VSGQITEGARPDLGLDPEAVASQPAALRHDLRGTPSVSSPDRSASTASSSTGSTPFETGGRPARRLGRCCDPGATPTPPWPA